MSAISRFTSSTCFLGSEVKGGLLDLLRGGVFAPDSGTHKTPRRFPSRGPTTLAVCVTAELESQPNPVFISICSSQEPEGKRKCVFQKSSGNNCMLFTADLQISLTPSDGFLQETFLEFYNIFTVSA